MKRFTVLAVPVVIALLTFGITVKAMAADVDDSAAANKGGNAAADESIAVKDTLNDNNVAAAEAVAIKTGDIDTDVKTTDIDIDKDTDIDVDKSHNNGDAEVERANHVANANNGSVAKVYEDNSINIKDVRVAVATNELDGEVTGAAQVGVPILGEIERSFNTGDNAIGSRGGEVELNGVANISQNTGGNSLIQQSNTFNASVK
jgi:hypothetical protein